mgnify:FL=1
MKVQVTYEISYHGDDKRHMSFRIVDSVSVKSAEDDVRRYLTMCGFTVVGLEGVKMNKDQSLRALGKEESRTKISTIYFPGGL